MKSNRLKMKRKKITANENFDCKLEKLDDSQAKIKSIICADKSVNIKQNDVRFYIFTNAPFYMFTNATFYIFIWNNLPLDCIRFNEK